MKVNLQKWGNSLGIRIPKKLLDDYKIKENDTLLIREDSEGFYLMKSKRLSLKERIGNYKFDQGFEEEIKGSVGNEEF